MPIFPTILFSYMCNIYHKKDFQKKCRHIFTFSKCKPSAKCYKPHHSNGCFYKHESIDKAQLKTASLCQFLKHVSGSIIGWNSSSGSTVSQRSFAARWMAAFLDYNTIGLSMFTVLLCIVLNETGIRSVCLAQRNGEPHPKFIPCSPTRSGYRNPCSQPERFILTWKCRAVQSNYTKICSSIRKAATNDYIINNIYQLIKQLSKVFIYKHLQFVGWLFFFIVKKTEGWIDH